MFGCLIVFIVVRSRLLDGPLSIASTGRATPVVHLGIAPLLTKTLALEELLSRRLARLGPTEEDCEQNVGGS